jgi:hypothetical protein
MKKIVVMLVVMFVAVANAAAQIVVVADDHSMLTFSNGYRYYKWDVPGGERMTVGSNVNVEMQRHFNTVLAREGQLAYQREVNRWRLAKPAEVVDLSTIAVNPMMGVGGMMVGGYGMVGMGNGAAMGGMVVGSGGMAGANSNVVIDNSNMMSTIGSGMTVYYDTGSNSLSVSGDPLMAAGRLFNFIGGSKKRQQTTNNANNGNVRIVYIDAATGQPVAAPRSNTRSSVSTPTTTTRTTTTTTRSTNNATNYSGYNFASGF